jgi:hypothetical protein
VKDGFLSSEVEVLGFRAFNRACNVCFDAREQTQTDPLGA